MSAKGYGFHLDSTDESYFDMRNSALDRYLINNLVGNSSFGGYVTNAVKFNIVYGPLLPDVLTRYTGYSGRPALPPKWAFAPWMSSDVWHTGGEVRYTISKYRVLGIPGSAFVFDSPWETGYNDFTWNTSQWGDSGVYSNINGAGTSNYLGFASIADMMTFIGTNGLLFARSGFTGSHAYPGYWAGDNQPNFGDANGLPSVVVAGLSSAMSGFSIWASDLGGYQNSNFGSTPDNLFMRWTQFGAF